MANNCLVTKLNGVVDNNNLSYLGFIILDSTSNSETQINSFTAWYNNPWEMKIISGDAYFTNDDGSVNRGQSISGTSLYEKTYIKGTSCTILIPKYIGVQYVFQNTNVKLHNIDDISWLLYSSPTLVYFAEPKIDLSEFNDVQMIDDPQIGDTRTIDVGGLRGSSYADFSPSVATKLRFTGYNGSLAQFTDNDISKLADGLNYIKYINSDCTATYKQSNSRTTILLLQGFNLGDYVDSYLMDSANKALMPEETDKKISITGTRTSASDAAVTTLKGMGITVVVNGTTL